VNNYNILAVEVKTYTYKNTKILEKADDLIFSTEKVYLLSEINKSQ